MVEEEVGGGDGRGPCHGLDPFQSLPVQRVGKAVRQGVGRFEGAVGAPRVAESEGVGVRQDPRCSGRLCGPASNVPGTVGERHGRIRFSGGEWSARPEGPELPFGTEVRVYLFDGATAVVSALSLTQQPLAQPPAGPAYR